MSDRQQKLRNYGAIRRRWRGGWFAWALVVPSLVFGTAQAQEGEPQPPVVDEGVQTLIVSDAPFFPLLSPAFERDRILLPAPLHLTAENVLYGPALAAEVGPQPPTSAENAPEPVCDPSDPSKCSTPLAIGDPAPYAGQLLSPDLAIDLGQRAELFDLRLGLELELATGLLKAELSLERQQREIDRQASEAQVALLTTRLEEAHHELWYRHPLFVATVSVILTGIVVVISIEALKAME